MGFHATGPHVAQRPRGRDEGLVVGADPGQLGQVVDRQGGADVRLSRATTQTHRSVSSLVLGYPRTWPGGTMMPSDCGRRKAIDVWDQLDLVRHDSLLAMYDAGG